MADILAIDPSLSSTGYAIFNNNSYVESGVIKTKIKNTSCNVCCIERLYEIKSQVLDLIEKYEGFNYLIIEGYSYTTNSQASSGLHELGGILKLLLYKHNSKIIIIPPQVAKKYLEGNKEYAEGRKKDLLNKEITMKLIEKRLYKNDFKTSDEADAFLFGSIMKDYLRFVSYPSLSFSSIKKEVFYFISNQIKEYSHCKVEHYELDKFINNIKP